MIKYLSTSRMRLLKLTLDLAASIPGPRPNSRYYPVPDGTPGAKTMEEIRAKFDDEEAARRHAQELKRQKEQRRHDEWEAEVRMREAECAVERATVRKMQAAEQAELAARRAGGAYSGPLTLKEAYRTGWVEDEPDFYEGERLTLKGHRLIRNQKTAVSRTEWKRRGYLVKPGETPHARVTHGECGPYEIFRDDQVVPTPDEAERLACIAMLDALAATRKA